MTHLFAVSLCLAGFTALAVASRRQQRDLIGRSLPLRTTYILRTAGAAALLSALGILLLEHGSGIGLVMFSGHTSMAAGIVYLMLAAYLHPNRNVVDARHR